MKDCTLNRPGFATICSFVKSCDDFKDYKSKLYDLCGLMDSYQSLVGFWSRQEQQYIEKNKIQLKIYTAIQKFGFSMFKKN